MSLAKCVLKLKNTNKQPKIQNDLKCSVKNKILLLIESTRFVSQQTMWNQSNILKSVLKFINNKKR